MKRTFLELPAPKRQKYTVTLAPEPEGDTCDCAFLGCTYELDDEVHQCDVCGQWFCFIHINMLSSLCDTCRPLPRGIQQEIIAFRQRLNL